MKKPKEPVTLYTSDNDSPPNHSQEEVEFIDAEKRNSPEEKAASDAVKPAISKRIQQNRDSVKRLRERKIEYTLSLEKQIENLTFSNSCTKTSISYAQNIRERLLIERQILNRELQSLNQRYIQSSEVYRRLQQERIDLLNLLQEQSRALNAADQDPNSMVEPQQIQTSGPSHQPGEPHNAARYSYGIMMPEQIQTSGPLHQQEHQPGEPHSAAHYSYGIMMPQKIQTSGPSHQQAHQPGEHHNAANYSYGIIEPQQILMSGPSHQQAHQPGEPHNAAHHSYGIMVPQQIQTSGPSHQQEHQPGEPHSAAHYSYGIMMPQEIQTSGPSHQQAHQPGGLHNAAHDSYGIMVPQQIQTSGSSHQPGEPHNADHHSNGIMMPQQIQTSGPSHQQAHQLNGAHYIMRQEAGTWEETYATRDQQVDAAGGLRNDAEGEDFVFV